MGKTLCIINIGNTHVQITCGSETDEIPTSGFTPDMIPAGVPCIASSVVPLIAEKIKLVRPDIVWVTCDSPGTPDFSRVEFNKLGADRIANTAQLLADGILPAMTVDCGTAVNCEIVDDSGSYAGGIIFPGRMLIRKSLNLFTAQLPVIPLYNELPHDFPGTSTVSDIRWGTDAMTAAGVCDAVARARTMFPGKHLRVVVCGGDRAFFMRFLDDVEDGGDDFTLRGIRTIYEKAIAQ